MRKEGGGSLFLFLVARETPGACVCCCCTCQTMAALLSIQSERPRWRFPPSANKGPGHPASLSPPCFLPSPHSLTSPSAAGPAEKTEGFSPNLPLLFSLCVLLQDPQFSCYTTLSLKNLTSFFSCSQQLFKLFFTDFCPLVCA